MKQTGIARQSHAQPDYHSAANCYLGSSEAPIKYSSTALAA